MTSSQRSAELARLWIESWAKMDMHLATGFVHTSPFGRLEERDHYLATVDQVLLRHLEGPRKILSPSEQAHLDGAT